MDYTETLIRFHIRQIQYSSYFLDINKNISIY